MPVLRLATRGSPLALRQAESVAERLRAVHHELEVEVVVVRTQGDIRTESLDQLGGQGIFVTEVEAALGDDRADVAVHSAKDMPSVMRPDLCLAAVPPRADPRDALVGCTLDTLPPGGLIATGSARRRAQLAHVRPDLVFTDLRGNMERRVSRGEDGSVSAVVVAVAALERLGWTDRLSDVLEPWVMLPQAGQGAIAVQCRTEDTSVRALLGAIDDEGSHRAVRAERAMLAAVGGSCTVPVAAWARGGAGGPGHLRLDGLLASADGHQVVRAAREGDDPEALGSALARVLLSEEGGSGIEGFGASDPATA